MDYTKIARELVESHTTFGRGDTKYQSYEPCHFGQGFGDTHEEAMSLFLAGNDGWRDIAYDILMDWEIEAIDYDVRELRKEWEDAQDTLPEGYDEWELGEEIRYALQDANTQDVALEWIQNMRPPLVRFQIGDGDDPDFTESDDDMTPELLLRKAGIEATEENLKAAQSIVANAYYPGCWRSLYGIFRLDTSKVGEGDTVHIKGGIMLWATNPYDGDGDAGEVQVDMTIPRKVLATDKGAPGYASDEVFGWYIPALPEPTIEFKAGASC